MKLIVGLGNPGKQYQNNRHNIGFKIVDKLLESYPEKTKINVPNLIGDLERISPNILVLKPTSYMNNSGKEVQKVLTFFKIGLMDLIVIHDEVDLPLGEVKLEIGRGSAGHRGVESIIEVLGSKDFQRVRVGVNRPPAETPTDQYVLEDFTTDEGKKLAELISANLGQLQNFL